MSRLDNYQLKIMECDKRIEEAMGVFEAKVQVAAPANFGVANRRRLKGRRRISTLLQLDSC
jgi:hypothetical protein